MPQIQIDEAKFKVAQQRAAEQGYDSVEAFVADMFCEPVVEKEKIDAPNLDQLFTPERMADVERISAGIKAGAKTYTDEEIKEHFKRKRESWRASTKG